MDTSMIEGGLNVTLTIRLLMHGKEVGSIIGKKGESVKKMREESGARINISEGNCPERIITLAGPTNAITIAGIPASIIECVKQICVVMLESPPKGVTIPYRPKPSSAPVIFAGGQVSRQAGGHACETDLWEGRRSHTGGVSLDAVDLHGAYTIQGQYAIPQPDLTKLHQLAMQQSHFPMSHGGGNTGFSGAIDASAPNTSHELTIPNDLIGCIIGRQGSKINEIRQMSGAQIKIANPVEGSTERQVTITGSAASISLAQYLINVSLENAKPSQTASGATPDHLSINLSQPSTPSSSTPSLVTAGVSSDSSLPNPLPTAPCVSSLLGMKPVPLLALNVMSGAKGAVSAAVSGITNKLKSDKPRFSPY